MREIWQNLRPVLLTLAGVAAVTVLGMRQLAGRDRRWVLLPNGLVMLPRYDSTSFFRDSTLVVTLGAHERAASPIRIAVYHAGSSVPIAEREVVAAIRGAVAERRDARVVAIPVASPEMALPAGVALSYDFWEGGGVRADVVVTCPSAATRLPGTVSALPPHQQLLTSRSVYARRADFQEAVVRDLGMAAAARCPQDDVRYVDRPDGGRGAVDPREVPFTSERRVVAAGVATPVATGAAAAVAPSPDAGADRALLASAARRDSLIAEAMARARAAYLAVREIRANPDTLRLSVGEVVPIEQALRLTALRDDGSVVERFTPLFSVEELSIARLSAAGLKGLAAGVTRLTIRPFLPGPTGAPAGGAQAHVVIKVER